MIVAALISLGALTLTAVIARRSGSPIAVVALALASGIWLVANRRLEGPVLVSFSPSHGLTTADLLGFAGYFYSLCMIRVRYRESVQHRHLQWALMTVCSVAFALWPLAKLFIWPGVSSHIDFSWTE